MSRPPLYPVRAAFCLVWLGLGVLRADIGDTREQLRARYGTGKEVGDQLLLSARGFYLSAYFVNDRVSMEIYSLSPEPDGRLREWTEERRQELLDRQAAGRIWRPAQATRSGERYWIRQDQEVAARFVEKRAIMVFLSMHPDKLTGKS